MRIAQINLTIVNDGDFTDEDLEDIEIADAVVALEQALPELPKGAKWQVDY